MGFSYSGRLTSGFVVITSYVLGTSAWAQDRPDRPKIEEIIDGIAKTEAMVFGSKSLRIRYERIKTEDVTPSEYSGGFVPGEWTLAHLGDKWFTERRFTQPKKTESYVVEDKPMTQIIKNGVLLEWRQTPAQAIVDRFKLGGNFYGGLFYTRNLSLNAPKHIAKSNGADFAVVREKYRDDTDLPFFPDFLSENKAHYKVSTEPEEVDGALCWVVEWPGMDRFCVDSKRGFAIPKRSYTWGPGKPLMFEFRNRGYREVKPGLWLPFSQIEDKYASIIAEKPALWGKVTARSEYRLIDIEFDKLAENFFDVKLPQGTRVIDAIRDFTYKVAGDNKDPFAAALAEAKPELGAKPELKQRRSWLLAISAAILSFFLIAYLLNRIWSRKNK